MACATPSPICAAPAKAKPPITYFSIRPGCRRSSMHSASSLARRLRWTIQRRLRHSLIGAALTLAANALARRPRELPAQLLARLSPEDAPGLGSIPEKARAHLVPPALVPLRPSFTPPGAELRRFEGHENWSPA